MADALPLGEIAPVLRVFLHFVENPFREEHWKLFLSVLEIAQK